MNGFHLPLHQPISSPLKAFKLRPSHIQNTHIPPVIISLLSVTTEMQALLFSSLRNKHCEYLARGLYYF